MDQRCDVDTHTCIDRCTAGQVFVLSDGVHHCSRCVTPGSDGLVQCASRTPGRRVDLPDHVGRVPTAAEASKLRKTFSTQSCGPDQVCALEVGSQRGWCIPQCAGPSVPDPDDFRRRPIDPNVLPER